MGTRKHRVVLETSRDRVLGDLVLPEEGGYRSRLSDLLNRNNLAFIALTSVEIAPHDGGPPRTHAFVAIARDHIEYAYELDEAQSSA